MDKKKKNKKLFQSWNLERKNTCCGKKVYETIYVSRFYEHFVVKAECRKGYNEDCENIPPLSVLR